MVFPVPAEPPTLAGPLYCRSLAGAVRDAERPSTLSHGASSARCNSSRSPTTRKAPLRIRMPQRIRFTLLEKLVRWQAAGGCGFAAGGQRQQRLCSLGRQVFGDFQQRAFSGDFYILKPIGQNTTQQIFIRQLRGVRRPSDLCFNYFGITTSSTRSRTSTNCAAPVLGCVSSRRRSPHWYAWS